MVFDFTSYRNGLLSLPNCLANSHFIETAGWAREDTGHVLVSRTSGEHLVAITTGKVSPFRLQCGPTGNFRAESKVQNDFSKAKFQLTLDAPDEATLLPIYEAGVSALIRLQKSATLSGDNRNLFQDEEKPPSIRLGTKIFEKRQFDVVDNTVYMSDLEGNSASNIGKAKPNPEAPTKVDEETDNWPIPDQMQKDLCKIKCTHYVQPLRAYLDNHFIEPNDVNGVLGNAIVEIHFSLKHYRIQREGDKGFDSFTANIEQINVLKRGTPKAPNPYKRHNPRIGPVEVKRSKLSIHDNEASTSTKRSSRSFSPKPPEDPDTIEPIRATPNTEAYTISPTATASSHNNDSHDGHTTPVHTETTKEAAVTEVAQKINPNSPTSPTKKKTTQKSTLDTNSPSKETRSDKHTRKNK